MKRESPIGDPEAGFTHRKLESQRLSCESSRPSTPRVKAKRALAGESPTETDGGGSISPTQSHAESHKSHGGASSHQWSESHLGSGESAAVFYNLMHKVKLFEDLQKLQIATENRAQAYFGVRFDERFSPFFKDFLRILKNEISELLECLPIYSLYLKNVDGLGDVSIAKLLVFIYPRMPWTEKFKKFVFQKGCSEKKFVEVIKFKGLRSLYHYAGYHVVDGKAPRKEKNQTVNWNTELRSILYMIGMNLKLHNTYYRQRYEEFLRIENERHPELTETHRRRRALRKMIKLFLKDLWRVWSSLEAQSHVGCESQRDGCSPVHMRIESQGGFGG